MRTITRLFDHHSDALEAVRSLEKDGRAPDISLLSNNAEQWHTAGQSTDARRDHDDDMDAGEGAAKGAGIGAVLGGAGGLLTGLGMLAIPGVGPVVAAGWLAATAAGAVGGAAVGGATGGLIGALTDSGESEEDAHVYAEGVRRGGTLVSVRAEDEHARDIAAILERHGGVVAESRRSAYREEGWSRFDPAAEPYDSDRITAERARYRTQPIQEERSFGRTEPTDARDVSGEPIGTTPTRTRDRPASRI